MAGEKPKILLSWSGGKDSILALERLTQDDDYEVVCLLTTVTDEVDRISMHGVHVSLLQKQASRLGFEVETIRIPLHCSNDAYEQAMAKSMETWRLRGVKSVAFGDLFLEDIRSYRESNLRRVGMKAVFPIWGERTQTLADDFVKKGYRAKLVCVDTHQMDASFCGREFSDVASRLPAGVDPCGERGEFHTFVYDGPLFSSPLPVTAGEKVVRPPFVFSDLVETVR